MMVVVLAFILAATQSACSGNSNDEHSVQLKEAQSAYSQNYTFGVVRTAQSVYSSHIMFFDDELNLVNTIFYPYADLQPNFHRQSIIVNGKLWLIPVGVTGFKDDRRVISLDLLTGAIREYPINQIAITGLTADDQYVYTISNLNRVGHVGRIDMKTGGVKMLDLPDMLPQTITVFDDSVYVFLSKMATYNEDGTFSDDKMHLYELSSDLTVISDVNLYQQVSFTGENWSNFTQTEDLFFFEPGFPDGDIEEPPLFRHPDDYPYDRGFEPQEFTICSYIPSTGEMRLYPIEKQRSDWPEREHYRIGFVLVHDDTMVLFFRPNNSAHKSSVAVYDTQTGELTSAFDLDYTPTAGMIRDGQIFVIGSVDDILLVRYQIEKHSLVEVSRADLVQDSILGGAARGYVSLMFPNSYR
jgi:hypothetical protein